MILSRTAAVLLLSVLFASLVHAAPEVAIPEGASSFQYADDLDSAHDGLDLTSERSRPGREDRLRASGMDPNVGEASHSAVAAVAILIP